MKNIINKFTFFVALSFVFISCGNLVTSENDDSIPQGKGKITISTDLQNGRSVLPTAIEETTTGLKWELVGTKAGESKQIGYWEDDTDKTAYQKMVADTSLLVDTGTWEFTLTASQNNATAEFNVLQAQCNSVQINAGNNFLNFVMQEATENAASGSIEFTLNFPENVVTKGIATLTPYEGTNPDTQDFTANAGTTSQFLSSITYKKEEISAGYYILKIQLQQEGDATTPAVEYINTYSCLIRVAPGLLSQGKYTLPDLAQLYTINYKLEGGYFPDSATTTSYNAYTSFALPEPTKEGYDFAGWYTQDYTDAGSITEKLFGNAGETETISEDITLYAKWKISWDGLKNQIENDSGISEFVITENLTATSTITVSKPFKITSDKNVTITRGNTTGNTSFTDAFFKVESAGNLELEGTENITITLDGGNANESPILATAPLITSSGNLTLTNCTLQNNKNTSTTPGGAIYISAGKFTMNGGIIGKEITGSDASTGKQSWQDAATETNHSNYAYAGGGGIYVASGDVTIKDAKVSYNYVPDDDKKDNPNGTSLSSGGGICMEKGYLILENTEVSYNRGYLGGGVRCYNDGTVNVGTLTLKNATIKGNAGKHYAWSNFGGALAIRNFDVICDKSAEASIIEENYSADGGAVFLEYTTSTLENIIIRNNSFNDNGYKYGSEMLLWENANISIASNTVNISSDNTTERKGIFINRSTDKLNLSGDISLNSPINLHFESGQSSPSTVTVAGNLSENNVATIYLVGNYTEGTQVLVAEDEVNLADQVGKFTLKNTDYKISDDGRVAQNSGGGGTVTGITYAGTDSTSSLPKFYITTAEGLATFRNIVNGTLLDDTLTSYTISADSSVPGIADYSITTSDAFTNISGVLQADIDLSGIEWIPIGTEGSPFEGSFDGQNKTISNLTISNATTENQGLFGVFDCSLSDEKRYLSNICVTGSITTSSPYAGGLVGQATNIVFQNCENYIEINSSSETVGGFVGQADTCDFIGCTNYADIISTSSASYNLCVGGIAGLITDVTAEYCYNAGDISANMSVGGIFGFEQSSSISYPTIEYCVNTGVITGSSYYGGIVGYASKALSLGYCANYGEITYSGNDDNLENGFILGGCNSSNTTRATEILSVGKSSSNGTAPTNPTYYAVSKNASVTYSYYDSDKLTDIQGLSFNGGGDALSTSELINGTTLDNFFDGDWNYQIGRYPIPNLKDNISAVAWDLLVRTVSEQ